MPVTNVIRFNDNLTPYQLGLKKVYHDTIPKIPQQYKDWLREETAEEFIHREFEHSGLGVMPAKGIGQNPTTDRLYYSATKDFTLRTFGLALEIQYEVIRWDLYKIFGPVAKELAKTAVIRYDLEAYGIFNNSFVTTDATYVNRLGEALCATSHVRLDGGTWKNRPSSAIGLSMSALQTATTDLRLTVDERGKFALYTPKTLVTHASNDWHARTLTMSMTNPENANEQYNNAKSLGLKLHSAPYITLTTAWWLLCDTKSDEFKIHMRKGDSPDLVKDMVPGSRNELWTSYCSFSIVVWQSRGMYGDLGV